MQKYKGTVSDSDPELVETSCALVLAIDNKLEAQAHGRSAPSRDDVKDAFISAETALRRILL
jgi:hypothetical protein